MKNKPKEQQKKKHSTTFVYIMSLVSIMGFLGIMMDSFFYINLDSYIASVWLLIMGVGFIIESKPKKLYQNNKNKIMDSEIAGLTTFVIGFLALIAGVLSIPQIDLQHHVFLAVRGVISVIAILFIIIQTWIVRS